MLEYILPTKPGRANGFSIRDNWLLKPKKGRTKFTLTDIVIILQSADKLIKCDQILFQSSLGL
ncbi:MAG UNVERIFIED_CONTAM: hypothetical protein LVR29_14815 [Microcystis novacekii LVE1205-3]